MAQTNAQKFIALGLNVELAKAISDAIDAAAGSYTDTEARNAIKTKTEIAALTGSSTAANIVTALQA